MAKTDLKGMTVNTFGDLPVTGSIAPDFTLTGKNLEDISLRDFAGKNIILNIFPSIDTGVCAASVRKFNKKAAENPDSVVICISRDLPFASARFCAAEGIDNVITASEFRDQNFSKAYGVLIIDSQMAGLHARAVVVIDGNGIVKYTELVPEIAQEPDYDKALAALTLR